MRKFKRAKYRTKTLNVWDWQKLKALKWRSEEVRKGEEGRKCEGKAMTHEFCNLNSKVKRLVRDGEISDLWYEILTIRLGLHFVL